MSVDVSQGGYYSVFGRMHCLDPQTKKFVVPYHSDASLARGGNNNNKLWLIVRYMKGCCVADPDLIN